MSRMKQLEDAPGVCGPASTLLMATVRLACTFSACIVINVNGKKRTATVVAILQ